MKTFGRPLLCLCLALFFFCPPLLANNANDDDFTAVLLVMAVLGASLMFGAMVVGALVTAFVLGLVAILISLGIFSASVAVGIYKRSFQEGFKTFVLIVSTLGGTLVGLCGGWLFVSFFPNSDLSNQVVLLTGTACGAAGGLLLGILLIKIIRWAMLQLQGKLAAQS